MSAEARWPIPESWSWTSFKEIAEITGGGTPPANDPSNFADEHGIPWITPADLTGYDDIYIKRGRRNLSIEGYGRSAAKLLPAGAVLLSSRAPIGYCAIAANSIATNQGFKSLTLFGGISAEFVRHYLKWSKQFLESLASGTTFLELSGSKLERVPFPIPPLAEQKRIVATLDALNTKSARARAELSRIETLVTRYKQAVLSKAFNGELTKNWRKQQLDLVEWRTSSVGAECEIQLGKMLDKAKNKGEPTRYLRNINVRWGSFDLSDLLLMKMTTEDRKKLNIKDGDLLLCEGGEPGRCAVWKYAETDISFQKALMRIRPKSHLLPDFLYYFISWMAKNDFLSSYFTGTTIKHLPQVALSKVSLTLAPFEEQREIVYRIDSAFTKIDRLAGEAKRALELVGKLNEAILAKAFRGELVLQDENDEPANVLLERIRREHAAVPKAVIRKHKRIALSKLTDDKKRTSKMAKTRDDVLKDHLTQTLKASGGTSSATDIWLKSGMNIDEFYKQLRTEMDSGQILEGSNKDQLVLADAR